MREHSPIAIVLIRTDGLSLGLDVRGDITPRGPRLVSDDVFKQVRGEAVLRERALAEVCEGVIVLEAHTFWILRAHLAARQNNMMRSATALFPII